jgi:hypothetical protein
MQQNFAAQQRICSIATRTRHYLCLFLPHERIMLCALLR